MMGGADQEHRCVVVYGLRGAVLGPGRFQPLHAGIHQLVVLNAALRER